MTFWDILLIQMLEFEKFKPTYHTTFKTDITKLGLVFLISNFFPYLVAPQQLTMALPDMSFFDE